jgi:hypothetical protein
VADIGELPLDGDLPAAGQFHAGEMPNIRRRLRRRAGIGCMEDVCHGFFSL